MVGSSTPREPYWFELVPVDAWFFRDSRPSNAGEDQSDLHSLFPPYNHTVVGAVRAALAMQMGWNGREEWSQEIKHELGDGFDNLGPLQFTGPFLARQAGKTSELLHPLPKHVLGRFAVTDDGPQFDPQDWLRSDGVPTSTDAGDIILPVFPVAASSDKRHMQQGDGVFVTTDGMQAILDGKCPAAEECVHRSALFAHESRVGINREQSSRTTKQGGMYSPQYVRLAKGVSLVVGVAGSEAIGLLPSYFPLGGESRLAGCQQLATAPRMPFRSTGDVLILASPATFPLREASVWYGAGPSQPASNLHSDLDGNVRTCVIDHPLRIGGFDSRTRSPLPSTPFVSPGAAWWLDEPGRTTSDQHLFVGILTALGYGLAFLGRSPT